MGRDEDGAAPRFQLQHHVLDLAGVHRVQAGGRFIQEQQFRVVDERTHERQPHLHALGKGPDAGVRIVGKPHRIQQLHRITGRSGVEGGKEPQVLQRGQLLVVVGQLEGHSDALVVVPPPGPRLSAPHRCPTAVPAQQPDQQLLGGGLARTAGAEESENLALTDGEVHAAHRRFRGLRIREGQLAHLDHLGHPFTVTNFQ
ncbi:Uncharacterised protein [Mycobacteroides abscessus subsp. abscessus]|nr:Uncharacterised protein [Mycobacteroides abscessus subsp. abscessus]